MVGVDLPENTAQPVQSVGNGWLCGGAHPFSELPRQLFRFDETELITGEFQQLKVFVSLVETNGEPTGGQQGEGGGDQVFFCHEHKGRGWGGSCLFSFGWDVLG